jgi:RsiW-degrading membrane proteinase PrsW (M82 family)
MGPFDLVLGFVPVLLFLGALVVLDSFKLVRREDVLGAIGFGAASAVAAYLANRGALELLHMDVSLLRRWFAPAIEEAFKALWVLWLVRRDRVGFLVDAGILGFASGAGFALVENLYYAGTLDSAHPLLWLVRGLGTAIMHGSTTAVVAIVAKNFHDRFNRPGPHVLLVGFVPAIAVHTFFNHLVLNPLVTTLLLLLLMPLFLGFVFVRSERATRDWLGTGMDGDLDVLDTMLTGEIVDSRVGQYLASLRERFPGEVVADMLNLLRLHLELAVRAKGILLAREAGLEIPPDDAVRETFEEIRYLERSIGTTGMLAVQPFLKRSSRELWQLHMLKGHGAGARS